VTFIKAVFLAHLTCRPRHMQWHSWARPWGMLFPYYFLRGKCVLPLFLILLFSFISNYDGIVMFKVISPDWAYIIFVPWLKLSDIACNYFTIVYVSDKTYNSVKYIITTSCPTRPRMGKFDPMYRAGYVSNHCAIRYLPLSVVLQVTTKRSLLTTSSLNL